MDASGAGLSLALVDGGQVLAAVEWREARSAGERLLQWVGQSTHAFGIPDRVAVGIGPGSFTGTRVAVTAAKTLAWGWGVPLHAASSLQALAASVANAPSTVVATSERRGDQAYLGVYFRGAAGAECLWADRRWVLPAVPEVPRRAGDPVLVVGPLAEDAAFIRALGAVRMPDGAVRPAEGLVRLVRTGQIRACDPRQVEPNYLRAALVTGTPAGSAGVK